MKWDDLMQRKKVVYLAPQMVMDVLFNWKNFHSIRLPVFRNIPEDSQCVSMSYDFDKDCIRCLFVSPEFEPVIPGLQTEALHPEIEYVFLKDKEITDE